MNTKFKKILKYILIGLASIILLIFVIISVTFNFILTPKKITPKIVQAVNKNLNAEFSVKSIELSFFLFFSKFFIRNGKWFNNQSIKR